MKHRQQGALEYIQTLRKATVEERHDALEEMIIGHPFYKAVKDNHAYNQEMIKKELERGSS